MTSLTDKYLVRLLAVSILTALGVLVVMVLLVDFLETARHLTGPKATVWAVVQLYLTKVPGALHLLLPVALVVGSCVAFARLGRGRELRALAAAGLGPGRLLRPVAVVAAVVTGLVVLLGEFAVPPALDRFESLMIERFGRIDSSWRYFRNHMWYAGDAGRLFRIARRSADGDELEYVIALTLDDDFHLVERIDARRIRRARKPGGGWTAERAEVRTFAGGEQVGYARHAKLGLDWTETPDRFRDLSGRPQQKDFAALGASIEDLQRRGLSAAEYRLELHRRFSHPLVGVMLVLLFFPWLVHPARRRSLAGALLEAFGLVLSAYLLVAVCTTAVSGGLVGPALGAWLPAGLLLLACLPGWSGILRRARRGRSP